MENYSFMQDKRYIEIVDKAAKAFKRAMDQADYQVKEEVIQNEIKAVKKEIRNDIKKFKTQKANEINKEIKRIEAAHKNNKNVYDDPTTELLQRQEFEMKIKAASNTQLKNILKDGQLELSEHQLNMMQVEFKGRGLQEESTRVYAVKRSRSVGSEYERDPNYRKLSGQLASLELLNENSKNTLLYYPTEDRPRTIGINTLDRVVNGFAGTSQERLIQQAQKVEEGVSIMNNNAQSLAAWKQEVGSKVLENEIDDYASRVVAGKDTFEPRKYEDADPRAIEGTEEYHFEDEFKYLKERYHEPNHPIYRNFIKENYEPSIILQYRDYLRSKHDKHLQSNVELAEKVQKVKDGHRDEPNKEKEEHEQAISNKIKEKEAAAVE